MRGQKTKPEQAVHFSGTTSTTWDRVSTSPWDLSPIKFEKLLHMSLHQQLCDVTTGHADRDKDT